MNNGFNFSTPYGNFSYPFNIYVNQSNPYVYSQSGYFITSQGKNVTYYNNQSRFIVRQTGVPNQPTQDRLLLIYNTPNGTGMPPFSIYYENVTLPSQGGIIAGNGQMSEKNMTLLGNYSGATEKTVGFNSINPHGGDEYAFAVFAPNGTYITSTYVSIPSSFTGHQATDTFFSGEMSLMSIFIPLMAAISAYMTFGRDKASGILESVLSRPVSRRSLMASRYIANVVAVFLASVAAFAVTSLVFYHYLGTFLPASAFLMGLWAMLVASAGFVGMVYLWSSMTKSQGSVLGFAIAISIVMDILWTSTTAIIPDLAISGALKVFPGSLAYAKAFVAFMYGSPTGFTTVASLILSGSGSNNTFIYLGNVPFPQVGLLTSYFIGLGIVWIAIPIVAALAIFSRKNW